MKGGEWIYNCHHSRASVLSRDIRRKRMHRWHSSHRAFFLPTFRTQVKLNAGVTWKVVGVVMWEVRTVKRRLRDTLCMLFMGQSQRELRAVSMVHPWINAAFKSIVLSELEYNLTCLSLGWTVMITLEWSGIQNSFCSNYLTPHTQAS
jgi:hypothetical protein